MFKLLGYLMFFPFIIVWKVLSAVLGIFKAVGTLDVLNNLTDHDW